MWELPRLKPDEIIMYLRKSRTDDPLLSVAEVLSRHEQRLDEWVERNLPGLGPVPEENRLREVVSGETIDSRPFMKELLRRIESPKIKAVLCFDAQRLSRGDLEDIGRLVKLLRYSNTLACTHLYTYDLRDERDRDSFERELKRGNEFLEYQKRIMNNGRLLSVQNGWYIGNKPPYGYDLDTVKEGRRTCYTLKPNPEQAKVVRMIFEMYAKGIGSHRIARTLDSMGIPAPKGGKWSPESMKRMRSNEHYRGKVVWNKRRTVKKVEDGDVVSSRPVNHDYLSFPGRHEAIIDEELWDAVQETRDKIPAVKSKARCTNPFAGLVYCQCGRGMSRRTYKNTPARLLCADQVVCRTPSCTVDEMITEVVKVLAEVIEDFEIKIKNNAGDSVAAHRELVAQLEKRLAELEKLEVSQWEKYTQEGMPKHIFETLNTKVLREKEETQQALCTARDTLPEPIDYEKKKLMFSDAVRLLQDPKAPALEQNMLLKKCIDHIEYTRKRKNTGNRRWGDPEPIELDIHLRV